MATHLDLGIAGRTAIVCGASSGLGKACAFSLAQAGVSVFMNARGEQRLEQAAAEIGRATGATVKTVAADISQTDGRTALLAACPSPDIVVTNAGGPPPRGDDALTDEQWLAAIQTNMLAPIQLINGCIDGMKARKWGRIINITSQAVKMPLPLLDLSNGARAGLTGYMSGLAREVAALGITVNNLLPGPFATDRLQSYAAKLAANRGSSPGDILAEFAERNPTKRIGRPEEFGVWCAFIASEHAGYITAQNFLLDGGQFPGLL